MVLGSFRVKGAYRLLGSFKRAIGGIWSVGFLKRGYVLGNPKPLVFGVQVQVAS